MVREMFQVYHLQLRPSKVLLDGALSPKLTGFGEGPPYPLTALDLFIIKYIYILYVYVVFFCIPSPSLYY